MKDTWQVTNPKVRKITRQIPVFFSQFFCLSFFFASIFLQHPHSNLSIRCVQIGRSELDGNGFGSSGELGEVRHRLWYGFLAVGVPMGCERISHGSFESFLSFFFKALKATMIFFSNILLLNFFYCSFIQLIGLSLHIQITIDKTQIKDPIHLLCSPSKVVPIKLWSSWKSSWASQIWVWSGWSFCDSGNHQNMILKDHFS